MLPGVCSVDEQVAPKTDILALSSDLIERTTWLTPSQSRVNVVVIVIGVAMFIAFMLSILSPFIIKNMRIDDGLLLTVIAVVAFVVAAALFVTAFAVNRFAVKKAEQYLLRHE